MARPTSVYLPVSSLHILNQKEPEWTVHVFITVKGQQSGLIANMAQLRVCKITIPAPLGRVKTLRASERPMCKEA